LRALLKKAGRQRGIDAETERLREAFRRPRMRQLPLVEDAMGRRTVMLVRKLGAACTSADDLAQAAVESFEQHPDARIITSFPGLGSLTGTRVLAEIGDDRSRFADARGLKAFAGAAPVTRASGKSVAVMARRVKNQRLAAVGYVWAFAALTASPGARAHYDRRRETPATGTPPPRETSSTACSAASTTASPAAPTTTRKSPSPPPRRPISLRPLDRSTASDVWRNTHAADKRLRKVVARANVA